MAKKKMGLLGIASMALLNVLGTGIFFGPALSAKYAGNAALLVWGYIGFQSIYIGMIFSELVSMYPKSGGVYEYAKQAYGHFASFIIGWIMWLVATIMIPILIISALLYSFPEMTAIQTLLTAILILFSLSLLAYRGLGESEKVLDLIAVIILVFVVITVIMGVPKFSADKLTPFFTTSPWMLFVALFFILETYFGWEAVTFMAEETKDPKKTIPKALSIATITAAVTGLVFSFIIFGIMGSEKLAQSTAPLYDIFVLLMGDAGGTYLRIGVFISLIGSAAGVVISNPRMLRSMARDKLFISQFSEDSEKTGTPAKAIAFQAIIGMVILAFTLAEYQLMLSLLVPLASIMYISTFLALPILRYKNPGKRPFECPLPRIGPIVVSLVFLGALAGWVVTIPKAVNILSFAASLVFLGVPVYFLLVAYYNPDAIIKMTDKLAKLSLLLERFILPRKVKEEILELFQDLEKKVIMEFGAGVGSLTLHLAEETGPDGKIYATDLSKKNIDILRKRLEKSGHTHVEVIHDEHQVNRVHPSIKQVDLVFSVGMLSYLQDVEKVLREMNDILPEKGRVCFVEYINFFKFIPDPPWMKNEKTIKEIFRKAGFSVHVKKKKGLFWDYLMVYGFKSEDDLPFI